MVLRSIVIGLLAITSYAFVSAPDPIHNTKEKESAIIEAVLKYLNVLHFSPKEVNDKFSEEVFDEYLKSVDNSKRFLLASEVETLMSYKTAIDDQINSRSLKFFDESIELIEGAITRAQGVYNEVLECEMDFTVDETYVTDADKRAYAKDLKELKEHWRKSIKMDILNKVDQKLKEQEEDAEDMSMDKGDMMEKVISKENTLKEQPGIKADMKKEEMEMKDVDMAKEKKTFDEIELEAIEETKESFDDWFERLAKVRRSDRFENYVNSITHVFDPHSDYYNPKEKKDFDIRMGGKLEGIGARLSPDGEYTKVVSIVPGGPAWQGKELEVNDLITGVTQEGEEPVDITGMRLDDVVSKIRGDKGTTVTLSVKRADGTFHSISIVRDEVIIDESFARSLILEIPDVIENVGYIRLPKFYSSFEGNEGNSCAVDVAKEVEKLKAENVNGIILDLRNNGGGSLQDVIKMTGLFIEEGPIVQVKANGQKPRVYEDQDPDVQYTGPMIVMVNEFSASASEILAAALQDYNRALIIGSESTFGKGTVQRFQNLDQYIQGMDDMKPLGEIKLTNQKFYRINGGSTQLKGVQSDIVLPDTYSEIDYGEKEYDYALPWTSIDPLDYSQDVYEISNVDRLAAKSAARVSANAKFELVNEQAILTKKYRDETERTLNLEAYRSYLDKREKESKQFEETLDKDVKSLSIRNLTVDAEVFKTDEAKGERNTDWIESTQKDFYLEEALQILNDIIEENS